MTRSNSEVAPKRLFTFVWCADCEEPTIQGMDVRVVLHLYGNRSSDFPKAADTPPTTWRAERPMSKGVITHAIAVCLRALKGQFLEKHITSS